MRVLLCLMLAAACALANKNDNRRNKLPFVADAVGNTLPPPSNVPATVGSPVNLITPDRYEFYTFDESGELVKRLMTLEEIQAIVAAGEESEGLVTFANDNQPTVSFNVNQPPYTKVHSVVTNVQNVLKAQMEAHKNRPYVQPTLDTPDVSDSWSLILPSIFGNTGVDIVLDKSSGAVTTPETETFEEEIENDDNSLSKEGNSQVLSSSSTKTYENVVITEKAPTTEIKSKEDSTTKAPTTKASITTTSTTTTTAKPTTTPKIVHNPPRRPITSATKLSSPTSKITTPSLPQTKVTNKPRTTTTTIKPTTFKPVVKTTTKVTTQKPELTTKKQVVTASTVTNIDDIKVQIHHNSNAVSSTEKNSIEFEKLSTFIPVSTVKYVTDRSTQKPITSTISPVAFASTTKRSVITTKEVPTFQTTKVQTIATTPKPVTTTLALSLVTDLNEDKHNATTITTQSVSPSTTVSTTEFLSADKVNLPSNVENKPIVEENSNVKDSEPLLSFDVAQSISQIASDLGSNFQPIPTTSNLLDTTNVSELELESKENLDMDIPFGSGNETDGKKSDAVDKNNDNFIQISTIDPHNTDEVKKPEEKIKIENISQHEHSEKETTDNKINNIIIDTVQKVEFTTTPTTAEPTTIDPILSESMGDLLSQVVNQAPTIVESENQTEEDAKVTTTENYATPTTTESVGDAETTTEISSKLNKETSTTTEKSVTELPTKQTIKTNNTVLQSQTDNKDIYIAETSGKINTETTPKPKETTLSVNNDIDKANLNEQTFVLISGSATKNNTNEELNKLDNSKVKDVAISNIMENKKEHFEAPQENKIIKNASKVSEKNSDNIPGIEITTILPELDAPNKNVTTNKITQSKINTIQSKDKINPNNKKDKLPEPLPKVDDFKKKIQKVNIDDEELVNQRNNSWKLVPTLSPPKINEIPKDKLKPDSQPNSESNDNKDIVLEFSNENQGLEVTTKDLGEDVARFSELSNELAFRYWNAIVDDMDKRRSFVFSPYSIFSMLAMIFMGARGATSGEMNEILKLDDMVTFNPHFALKNISDSIEAGPQSGVGVSVFTRELYSDRNKGKILTFYKERAQHFYNGHVEEINFKLISDIIRRRTNLLVKRYTWGKIPEYMKTNNIVMQAPLAAFTANIFETDCTGTSVEGRDGEMYFVVSPNVRQRRLVPVPAVVYKKGFLAGYDPVLDVTVAALGNTNTIVSTMFLMPGQQGNVVHVDDLEKLEQRLLEATPTTPTWNRVLRSLLPRTGLELQIPRFSHKSTFNASLTLKKMGLKDLFDGEHADLGGLNGPSKDLYLSDMVQLNTFVTCGEGVVGEQHHIEEYPETLTVAQRRRARWLNDWDEPRDYQRAFHDPHDISDAMHLPLHLRPRQARLPARSNQPARLKFDRPFLYFVRHNPSGMILYFGRYNPRLLP